MYDAIVVGARCAGSSTAMLLARKGSKVLLVDKATFPSDTLSSHQLQIAGSALLKKWGVLDEVLAAGFPPARRLMFELGPVSLHGSYPALDGVAAVYSPKRHVLDTVLLRAAERAGAEVRTDFTVQELLFDGDRMAGVKGRAGHGAAVEERARIVIGADGMRSLVANSVRANAYNERPTLSCAYYTYWEGVETEGGEMYGRPDRSIGVWPTNEGQVVIYLGMPHQEFAGFRLDVEGNFMRAMEAVPHLAERLRAGRRADRIFGTGELPNFFRKPYGPGWALVGDAGYHRDSITGQGMSDAFRSAELLADALHAAWSGEKPIEGALAGYERQRNEAVMPMYELTCQIASFAPPPPEQQVLFEALAYNEAQRNRFFGVMTGSVPYREFFSPGNLLSILGVRGMAKIALRNLRQRAGQAGRVTPQHGGLGARG